MGRDKALLPVGGVAMARRVADALAAAGAVPVVAQGGDADALDRHGLVVRPDRHPGDGPLPATVQAIVEAAAAGAALVVVLSCDLVAPDADAVSAVVAALVAAPDALGAVPVDGGHRQWTHGAWRAAAGPALGARYAAGARSLKRASADLPLVEVAGLPAAALADADQPSDLPG